MEKFQRKFQIRNIEESPSAHIRSQWTELDDGLAKVHNAKHIKEIVRQFECKHGDVAKENVPIPPSYHPEKYESRHLAGKEITEFQRMIGMFQ